MRLYNRPRVADSRRLMLIMVPGSVLGRSLQDAELNVNNVHILSLTSQFMICRHKSGGLQQI